MLVVILVSFLAFGFEIDAKQSQNNKFDRSDKLINRNLRDLNGLFDELYHPSRIEFSCDQSSCTSSADRSVCPGFCKENTTLMAQAMTAISKCLRTYPCNLNEWKVNQVEFPLGVKGYDGVCSLSGNVTVNGGSEVSFYDAQFYGLNKDSLPMYLIDATVTHTYSGLSVTCSPMSADGGSGNELSSKIFYLVNCFLSDLLNLFDPKVRPCAGNRGSKFTTNVTVKQVYYFHFVNVFFASSTYLTGCTVFTSAKLGTGVPDEYEKQVKEAIQMQLDNFSFINGICHSYVFNVATEFEVIYRNACPKSNCKTP